MPNPLFYEEPRPFVSSNNQSRHASVARSAPFPARPISSSCVCCAGWTDIVRAPGQMCAAWVLRVAVAVDVQAGVHRHRCMTPAPGELSLVIESLPPPPPYPMACRH